MFNRNETPAYRKYVPFLDSSYNLYTLIYLTQIALFRTRYNEVRELGVTSMEAALLLVVNGLGEQANPAEISRWMMRKRPTISGLLDRMERNGLVIREGYNHNRKLKKVIMTPKGREALDQIVKRDSFRTIISSLSDEEYAQLWSLLEKLKDKALLYVEATDVKTNLNKE
jgi:DNA-binding MarR family transcriptional regulator